MGRRLRPPNELLRSTAVAEAGELTAYHEGDRVWVYRPLRGPRATKFVHSWIEPLRIIEEAGYNNYLLEREDGDDTKARVIAHVSLFVSYHYPVDLLPKIADDIVTQLEDEEEDRQPQHEAAGDTIDKSSQVNTCWSLNCDRFDECNVTKMALETTTQLTDDGGRENGGVHEYPMEAKIASKVAKRDETTETDGWEGVTAFGRRRIRGVREVRSGRQLPAGVARRPVDEAYYGAGEEHEVQELVA
ncbi:hypothetical protein PHMEG_0005037 [Phytophthora megakarya]|uniref:Uncharacterized protein n=1 Tax=Phytophthora megakarya TaxID=4795 RepID=A0A225WSF8_9STRA|nr:hypothetical protein PHMEG_0005037 [Phytophthora megakarya]